MLYKTRLEILRADVAKSFELLKPEHAKMLEDLQKDKAKLEADRSHIDLERTKIRQIESFIEHKMKLTQYKLSGDIVNECSGIVNSVLDIQDSSGSYCKSVFVKEAIVAEQQIETL